MIPDQIRGQIRLRLLYLAFHRSDPHTYVDDDVRDKTTDSRVFEIIRLRLLRLYAAFIHFGEREGRWERREGSKKGFIYP